MTSKDYNVMRDEMIDSVNEIALGMGNLIISVADICKAYKELQKSLSLSINVCKKYRKCRRKIGLYNGKYARKAYKKARFKKMHVRMCRIENFLED